MLLRKNTLKTLIFTSRLSIVILGLFADISNGKTVHQRAYKTSPMLYIVNGTDSLIRESKDGFVYCFSNLRTSGRHAPLRVVWTNPKGEPLMPNTGTSLKTENIFSVQQDYLRPNAYLVFRKFDETLEGKYTCNLIYLGRLIALRTIQLKMFRPSFRVVAIPKCLTVRAGGTLLIPSPVMGSPTRPPMWRRIGGDNDFSTALQLSTGLLLHNVQESAIYRAVARLGGGLTHQQDVTISVINQDGIIKDIKTLPRVVSSAPTKCPRAPVPGSPLPYSSSVERANDLIADMQMALLCKQRDGLRNK